MNETLERDAAFAEVTPSSVRTQGQFSVFSGAKNFTLKPPFTIISKTNDAPIPLCPLLIPALCMSANAQHRSDTTSLKKAIHRYIIIVWSGSGKKKKIWCSGMPLESSRVVFQVK